MSAALTPPDPNRTTRLTALVSATEAEQIARQAAASGLSVSASYATALSAPKPTRTKPPHCASSTPWIERMENKTWTAR